MWRAYGGNAGVAIIFKHDLFKMLTSIAKLDFSSVAYLKDERLKKEIANLGESISSNLEKIKTIEPNILGNYLFNILRFSALCNKHKGFEEEQEWRLIATASVLPQNEFIAQEILTIRGTPQKIVKIKLSEATYEGLQFKDMIDKDVYKRQNSITPQGCSLLNPIARTLPSAMSSANVSSCVCMLTHAF